MRRIRLLDMMRDMAEAGRELGVACNSLSEPSASDHARTGDVLALDGTGRRLGVPDRGIRDTLPLIRLGRGSGTISS